MGHKFKVGDVVFWKGTSDLAEILETCIIYDAEGRNGDYGYVVQMPGWAREEKRTEKNFLGYKENMAYIRRMRDKALDRFYDASDALADWGHRRDAAEAKKSKVTA